MQGAILVVTHDEQLIRSMDCQLLVVNGEKVGGVVGPWWEAGRWKGRCATRGLYMPVCLMGWVCVSSLACMQVVEGLSFDQYRKDVLRAAEEKHREEERRRLQRNDGNGARGGKGGRRGGRGKGAADTALAF